MKNRNSAHIAIPVLMMVFSSIVIMLHFLLHKISLGMVIPFSVLFLAAYLVIYFSFHIKEWRDISCYGKLNYIPHVFIWLTGFPIGLLMTILVLPLFFIGIIWESLLYKTATVFFATITFISGGVFKSEDEMPEGKYIIIMKHSSFIESMAMAWIVGFHKWSVIVHKKMNYFPPINFFLWGRAVFFDKKRRKEPGYIEKIGNKMAERVKKGYSFVFFPESTRFSDGNVHDFKIGALKLAEETQTPILILGLRSPWLFKPKNRKYICPGVIDLTYIGVVDVVGKNAMQLSKECFAIMSSFYEQ